MHEFRRLDLPEMPYRSDEAKSKETGGGYPSEVQGLICSNSS